MSMPTVTEWHPYPDLEDPNWPDFAPASALRACFTCTDSSEGVMRRVTGEFTTDRADPTAAYRLACGHTAIDVY